MTRAARHERLLDREKDRGVVTLFSAGRSAVAISALIAVAACSSETSTQDVAKGKDFALSRTEYNQALSTLPQVPKGREQAARKQVLDRLIDEKLLADAAIEEKLDRQADTMQALEAARRATLARAYALKLVAGVQAPTNDEIATFYNQRQDMYAKRFVAALEQVTFNGDAAKLVGYRTALTTGTPIDTVAKQAQADGVAIAPQAGQVSSDQLPPALAQRVSAMTPGQVTVDGQGQTLVYLRLKSSTPAPLTLEQATPLIRNGLMNAKKAELVKNDVARLRKQADVKIIDQNATPAQQPKG